MTLLMEGERKRRKIIDDEDVKMERFFALIRNAKDIRDRLLGKEGSRHRERPTATVAETAEKINSISPTWQPSFEPEDFGENGVLKADLITNQGGGSSMRSAEDGNKKADDDDHSKGARIALDLNLSLY